MHIEPGYIAAYKVTYANIAATSTLGYFAYQTIKERVNLVNLALRTVFTTIFFSLFMQLYHAQIGPSELHFIGAMAMYFTLGFLPTLFGFALGLLLQGFLFTPSDLIHLSVNSLSLIVPLLTVHYLAGGKKMFDKTLSIKINLKNILKYDSIYYSAVVSMVGFWLLVGDIDTALSSWLKFASSYLIIVMIEPFFTWSIVKGLKALEDKSTIDKSAILDRIFITKKLTVS